MSSSLQRALGSKTNNCSPAALAKAPPPPSKKSEKNSFEASFAGGLDLSEFGASGGTAGAAAKSHSAALLRIKEKEAAQKAVDDQEEQRMQTIVRARIQKLQQHRCRPGQQKGGAAAAESSNFLVGALVGMHGSDLSVLESKNRKPKTQRLKALDLKSSCRSSGRKGNKRVAKKTQSRKY